MHEEWRTIPSYPSYEASSLGRIRRVAGGRGAVPGRVRRNYVRPDGYAIVSLSEGNRVSVERVHRLVAEAWLGKCPEGMEVNHRNGQRDDNRVANLEYVTRAENMQHAFGVLGRTVVHGDNHGNAKLTSARVRWIRMARKRGERLKTLAQMYGVAESTISRAYRGEYWAHVQ
ncbi:MAG: hypothetical protein GX601_07980 [Anaerolineales bacterium]|nr:hypothetical protein [Anaerolineales bacterium]